MRAFPNANKLLIFAHPSNGFSQNVVPFQRPSSAAILFLFQNVEMGMFCCQSFGISQRADAESAGLLATVNKPRILMDENNPKAAGTGRLFEWDPILG